jgi:hypothetical protein
MLKICKEKWNKNSGLLLDRIRKCSLDGLDYIDLVKMSVDCILNDCEYHRGQWDFENITVIDNGDYQGTLIFVIPRNCYQPNEFDYLITFAGYGSCSGCDSLLSITEFEREMTDRMATDILALCKDLITNIVKPYNYGWRCDEQYTVEEMK